MEVIALLDMNLPRDEVAVAAMANAHAETRRRRSSGAPERKATSARAKGRGFDPVTAEIIRAALETICYEVAAHVGQSTAATPAVDWPNERDASIFDARGRLAALSVGIPQFMVSSALSVRFALDFFGPDGLQDGDVLIGNDPCHGAGRASDYNV